MRWLFTRQLRSFVVLAGAASLVLNIALLMPALYMMQVFDRVFASGSAETLLMLTLITLLFLVLAYFVDTVRARALSWAGRSLDKRLSALALRTSLHEAATRGARPDADVLRDIAQLRSFLGGGGILALFDAPWLPLYLLLIGLMHPSLGFAAAAGAVTLICVGLLTERLTREQTERALRLARSGNKQAESLLRNAEVIAGMGMGQSALSGWRATHDELLDAQSQLGSRSAALGALARVLRQVLQVAMLTLGAWLVIDMQASAGVMIAATILLGRALQPVEQLIGGWKALIEARTAWQRLCERPAVRFDEDRVALPAPKGQLTLERISFSTSSARPALLKNVGFTIEPGESVGIIGPSAAGKTTLLRLMLGLAKPTSGTVRLDGADIAQWDREALGRHIGYVPQDVALFAGTVAQNIARLGALDSVEIVKAARLAHAHEMILRLPQGYETQIGESGAILSGGQRQRIALARALYGEPRLVVLDEPNAHLDAEGETALASTLRELKAGGVTVVMVCHRTQLISQLDKLVVLKEGGLDLFGRTSAVLARLKMAQSPNRVVPFQAAKPTEVGGTEVSV